MTRCRSLLCWLTGALLLLAQLHVGGSGGCSMCGASCRCASRTLSHPCSVRSVGCGDDEGGTALSSAAPLRAVLAATGAPAPRVVVDTVHPAVSPLPEQSSRPPLDRPPRSSC